MKSLYVILGRLVWKVGMRVIRRRLAGAGSGSGSKLSRPPALRSGRSGRGRLIPLAVGVGIAALLLARRANRRP